MNGYKDIHIDNLLVNTENFRFDPLTEQSEAISVMIEDQGDKLCELINHILDFGLNPIDNIIVTPHKDHPDKYIVLEGNRRVISMKLSRDTDLVGNSIFKKKFIKTLRNRPLRTDFIRCYSFDNADEANTWIKLKHTGENKGAGTVSWNATQVDRFNQRNNGKVSLALQAIDLLSNSENVSAEIKEGLRKIRKKSNLDRLLGDPDIRESVEIQLKNGILEANIGNPLISKKLINLINVSQDPKFKVRQIYEKKDRTNFIRKLESHNQKSEDADIEFIREGHSRRSRIPKERKKLILRNCDIVISKNVKVESIFRELRKLEVETYTNAVAVLLRVFIELSIDCYRERQHLSKTPSSSTSRDRLSDKIEEVASHLKDRNITDKAINKGILTAKEKADSILSVDTLHAYVHSNKFSPIAKDLFHTWDNIEVFMTLLWENID